MTNEEIKKYINIKKLFNNDNLYINNDLYTDYKIKDKWEIEDFNEYSAPINWDIEYNSDYIAPITWATSTPGGDKYYHYENYPASLESPPMVSADAATDSKKESKNTTEQDSAKNNGAIIDFDWDKMF